MPVLDIYEVSFLIHALSIKWYSTAAACIINSMNNVTNASSSVILSKRETRDECYYSSLQSVAGSNFRIDFRGFN